MPLPLGADDFALTRGVDEHAVALPALHHFGVAGHDLHGDLLASRLDRQHFTPERLDVGTQHALAGKGAAIAH